MDCQITFSMNWISKLKSLNDFSWLYLQFSQNRVKYVNLDKNTKYKFAEDRDTANYIYTKAEVVSVDRGQYFENEKNTLSGLVEILLENIIVCILYHVSR